MKNKIALVAIFCTSLLISLPLQAKELSLEDILASSNAHYPKIKSALAKQDAALAKSQEAYGAFDLRLDGDVKLRGSGYYDGDYGAARLVKPIAPFSGELYTGYRNGHGDFPIYNEELRTKDSGEVNVGIIFSLLRNRNLDDRRFKIQDAEYEQNLAVIDLLLTRIHTQLKAQHAYAEWLAAGYTLKVYKNLLSLADERQDNLTGRIKAGDAPTIMATENEQNLLKRKALLNEAKRDFTKLSHNLSLFWRDASGDPVVPNEINLPKQFPQLRIPEHNAIKNDITKVISSRPELQAIAVSIQQQRNRVHLGENSLLPKVDLGLEVARDQGNGSQRLDGTDTIAMIKVSLPLQRNLGEGQTAAAKAQLRQLENEQRLSQETIKVELNNLVADLELNQSNLSLSNQEVVVAEKMQKAERQLLENGASNLFLVNSREEKTAEAKIKNILSNMYVFKALGSYNAATMQFSKLAITTNTQPNSHKKHHLINVNK
jgi:outer membrane protein TolC